MGEPTVPEIEWWQAVAYLDDTPADDPEHAHGYADSVLLDALPAEVGEAYERLVKRCRSWAYA